MRLLASIALLAAVASPGSAQDFTSVAARADGAVGRVFTEGSTGSGFVVAQGGAGHDLLFVTNSHVVEGEERPIVAFGLEGGAAVYAGRVLDRSDVLDLAVLGLTKTDGPAHAPEPLPLALRAIRKAERVAAIGFPGSSDSFIVAGRNPAYLETTFSDGAVSKVVNGDWGIGHEQFQLLQHTAPINSGNSGGPLIDLCGGLVGVNTIVVLAMQGSPVQGSYWASSAGTLARYLDRLQLPYARLEPDCASGPSAASPAVAADGPAAAGGGVPGWALAAFFLIGAGLAGTFGAAVLRARSPQLAPPAPEEARPPDARPPDAPAPGFELELRVTDRFGRSTTRAFALQKLLSGLTIGRSAATDIALDDGKLSREHAQLRLQDRRLTVIDLGSTNGTRVDGRRLKPHRPAQINSASRIELGDHRLSVRQLPAAAAAPAAKPAPAAEPAPAEGEGR